MVLSAADRKARRAAGMLKAREGMTKVHEIHRQFTTGRPPTSELRTPAEAVRSARFLFAELQAAMAAKGIKDPECAVKVAYVNTDFSMAFTQPFIPGKESELLKLLTEQPVIVIGLIFVMRDKEAKSKSEQIVAGMKPFLVTKQTVGWLRDLLMQPHDGMN